VGRRSGDWLPIIGALLVPLVIALGTWAITWQLAKLENQRTRQAQKIENQRAEAERELAVQRAQDEALQSYLNQMSSLLLEKDLRTSKEDSEVRTLARARTLTVLGRLDPSRKTAIMQFLVEADLVQRVDGKDPIISLSSADLSDVGLLEADLSGAFLRVADLSGADLSFADLSDTDLSAALSDAYLYKADLSGANLSHANLSGAYLGRANLSEARGWTEKQLQQAKSLIYATMPNGQKYEDWLKSQGREENE
jgi:uncharacterized protein YjbI with pentapeptide repeats